LKGNAAIVYRGQIQSKRLYLAEGPETAASVALGVEAVKFNYPVLASLSLGSYINMTDIIAGRSLKLIKMNILRDLSRA
jgi:hypothetical protein